MLVDPLHSFAFGVGAKVSDLFGERALRVTLLLRLFQRYELRVHKRVADDGLFVDEHAGLRQWFRALQIFFLLGLSLWRYVDGHFVPSFRASREAFPHSSQLPRLYLLEEAGSDLEVGAPRRHELE